MRILMLIVVSTVTLCAFGYANATNYYMNPTGSDAAAGTSTGAAWATLRHARSILVAGDTLFVMGGTYNTAQGWTSYNYRSSGTTLHPIVVKAYGDAVATFTMADNEFSGEHHFFCFGGSPSTCMSHFVLDGESHLKHSPYPAVTRFLVFKGHSDYGMFTAANSHPYRSSGLVVRGCEFDGTDGNKASALLWFAEIDSFIVENNYIHNGGSVPTGNIPPGDGTEVEQGSGDLLVMRSCQFGNIRNNTMRFGNHGLIMICAEFTQGAMLSKYILVQNNILDNGWGGGVFVIMGSHWCLVENNIISHCGASTGYPKPAIEVNGNHNTVRKNVIYCPSNLGITLESQRNIHMAPPTLHNYVYNNTIFNTGQQPIAFLVSNNGSMADSTEAYRSEYNLVANNLIYKLVGLGTYPHAPIFAALYFAPITHAWVNPFVSTNYPSTTAWGHNKIWNNLIRLDSRGLARDTMVCYTSSRYLDGNNYCNGLAPSYIGRIRRMENDGSGAWANNCGGDPKLVSESPDTYGTGWWYLQAGSAAIDSGIAVVDSNGIAVSAVAPDYGWGNLIYGGTAPDIGAHEFNAEDPSPLTKPSLSDFPTRKR